MLAVKYRSNLYKSIFYIALIYIFSMSLLELLSGIRIFSILHLVMCLTIVVFMVTSYKYLKYSLKIWTILLMFSGGMVLLSTMFYLVSGTLDKISLLGNIFGAVNFIIGIVLHRYFEKSVLPVQLEQQ